MESNQPNSIKYNFFRVTAVLITLCFILGPARLQIQSVLHTVSHNLTPPSYVIQHSEVDNNNYKNGLSLSSGISASSLNHQHQIIDLFDIIFDGQSENNFPEDGATTDFKIKKHTTSNSYAFNHPNTIETDVPNFVGTRGFYKKAYLNQLYRPPKVS